jgi:hypothetical protein
MKRGRNVQDAFQVAQSPSLPAIRSEPSLPPQAAAVALPSPIRQQTLSLPSRRPQLVTTKRPKRMRPTQWPQSALQKDPEVAEASTHLPHRNPAIKRYRGKVGRQSQHSADSAQADPSVELGAAGSLAVALFQQGGWARRERAADEEGEESVFAAMPSFAEVQSTQRRLSVSRAAVALKNLSASGHLESRAVTYSSSSSQRLHYGSVVSLEQEGTGAFLVVDGDSGDVQVRAAESRWQERGTAPFRPFVYGRGAGRRQISQPVFTFRVVDLRSPHRGDEVRFGDPVWLVVSNGRGESDWQSGSVLGGYMQRPVELNKAIVPSSSKLEMDLMTGDAGRIVGSIHFDRQAEEEEGDQSQTEQPGLPVVEHRKGLPEGATAFQVESMSPTSKIMRDTQRDLVSIQRRQERLSKRAHLASPSKVASPSISWPTLMRKGDKVISAPEPTNLFQAQGAPPGSSSRVKRTTTPGTLRPAGLGRDIHGRIADELGAPRPVNAFLPADRSSAFLLGPLTAGNSTGVYFEKDPGFDLLYDLANRTAIVLGCWHVVPARKTQIDEKTVMGALGPEPVKRGIELLGRKETEPPEEKEEEEDSIAEASKHSPAQASIKLQEETSPAEGQKMRAEGDYVQNGDAIFLNQDWTYLCAAPRESNAQPAVTVPPVRVQTRIVPKRPQEDEVAPQAIASMNSFLASRPTILEQLPESVHGDFRVERRGVFRLRMLNPSTHGSNSKRKARTTAPPGSLLAGIKLESRGRAQLSRSGRQRRGVVPSKQYSETLQGGQAFPAQVRFERMQHDVSTDSLFLEYETAKAMNPRQAVSPKAHWVMKKLREVPITDHPDMKAAPRSSQHFRSSKAEIFDPDDFYSLEWEEEEHSDGSPTTRPDLPTSLPRKPMWVRLDQEGEVLVEQYQREAQATANAAQRLAQLEAGQHQSTQALGGGTTPAQPERSVQDDIEEEAQLQERVIELAFGLASAGGSAMDTSEAHTLDEDADDLFPTSVSEHAHSQFQAGISPTAIVLAASESTLTGTAETDTMDSLLKLGEFSGLAQGIDASGDVVSEALSGKPVLGERLIVDGQVIARTAAGRVTERLVEQSIARMLSKDSTLPSQPDQLDDQSFGPPSDEYGRDSSLAEEELRMTSEALASPERKVRSRNKRRLSWDGGAEDSLVDSLIKAGAMAGDPAFDMYQDPVTGMKGKPGSLFTFSSSSRFQGLLGSEDSKMGMVAKKELELSKGSSIMRDLLGRDQVYCLQSGTRLQEVMAGLDESQVHAAFVELDTSDAMMRDQLTLGRAFHRESAMSPMKRLEVAASLLDRGRLEPGAGQLAQTLSQDELPS